MNPKKRHTYVDQECPECKQTFCLICFWENRYEPLYCPFCKTVIEPESSSPGLADTG